MNEKNILSLIFLTNICFIIKNVPSINSNNCTHRRRSLYKIATDRNFMYPDTPRYYTTLPQVNHLKENYKRMNDSQKNFFLILISYTECLMRYENIYFLRLQTS